MKKLLILSFFLIESFIVSSQCNCWNTVGATGIIDENSIGKINLGRVKPVLARETSNPVDKDNNPKNFNPDEKIFGFEEMSASLNIKSSGLHKHSLRYSINPFNILPNSELKLEVYFKIITNTKINQPVFKDSDQKITVLLKKWALISGGLNTNQSEIVSSLLITKKTDLSESNYLRYHTKSTEILETLDFRKNIYFIEVILESRRKYLIRTFPGANEQNSELILGPVLGGISICSNPKN